MDHIMVVKQVILRRLGHKVFSASQCLLPFGLKSGHPDREMVRGIYFQWREAAEVAQAGAQAGGTAGGSVLWRRLTLASAEV